MIQISKSLAHSTQKVSTIVMRSFATKPPGSDPLSIMRKECLARNLCDSHGSRRDGVHWVFSVAISPDDLSQPPNLRTVNIQRITEEGIDFVMKRGSGTCDALAEGRPLSILHLQGRFMPGERAEQWRGEGHCERLLLDDYIHQLPHYTITAMVSSKRLEQETKNMEYENDFKERTFMENKSHATEVHQQTRLALENGEITQEEIDGAIKAFRFHPTRLECMVGGPDCIMWDRWEWRKNAGDNSWDEPKLLLPH